MESIKVILNPTAGRGYGNKVEGELRRYLEMEGLDYDLVRTEGPWHASELAEEAARDGFDVVAAAGGDGTSNEVINGLMAASEKNGDTSLALIPIGSGCDFAATVGASGDLQAACQRLARGQRRSVDVGWARVDEEPPRYFGNIVGIGFDGRVNVESRKIKWLRGLLQYLPAVLSTVFLYYKAPRVTIQYDEQELAMPALMICIGNGPREGGGFQVTPQALPDDGLFDLCIAHQVSQLQMLRLIPLFLKGTHTEHEAVHMARGRHVTVSSPDELVAHMDGEILCTGAHRIECRVIPQRLLVVC